jgi:hypothetical protein
MDDANVWYDAYTAYLKHQLGRDARAGADWRPSVVLDAVERLWHPTEAPRWDHLVRGLTWASAEHEHSAEFGVAIALAKKLAKEHAAEQALVADVFDCQETEGYYDRAYAERQEEWERTRKLLYGDEDSSYFWDRFRWRPGG